MFDYFFRRVLWIIPVLLTVGLVTFFLMHRAPGGPWDREKPVAAATEARLNAKFGLDKPLWFNPGSARQLWQSGARNPLTLGRAAFDSQFFNYMINAARGDLGPSYESKGTETVQAQLKAKFPISAKLGLVALAFAIVLGLPLGILGALRQNTILDYVSLFVATVGIAVPSFIVGVLLIIFMSSNLGIAPLRRPDEWLGLGPAGWDRLICCPASCSAWRRWPSLRG
jgi:oligopeptide transport system permease protein